MNAEEVAKETIENEFYMGDRPRMARALLVAIETLEFYAEKENYRSGSMSPVGCDLGEEAREALKKIRGEG